MKEIFRSIPSVDKSLKFLLSENPGFENVPKKLLKENIISFWDKKREEIKKGIRLESLDLASQGEALMRYVKNSSRPKLRRVLNGTGVVIHTNLGRSPLAKEAADAVALAAQGYVNLEMDLRTGERGSRNSITQNLLCELTGAEDSLVVNNNAAAVLLMLDTLCAGGETIVSRGELVEIGGSFRIPDIMRKSGSILREVGTTNRTHLADYENAINDNTRAIMHVHASNFRITGFHAAVGIKELKKLAAQYKLPLVCDLGSGNLLDFTEYGRFAEPTVRQVVEEGADIVCFSGDKALGGSQAGIICGKSELIRKLAKNPLTRALRCDKLCIGALEATLRLYLDKEKALKNIPVPAMIAMGEKELAENAKRLARGIKRMLVSIDAPCSIKLVREASRVGGGSFPECELPTTLVALYPEEFGSQELRDRLLNVDVPLIGRLEKNAFCLDPRTLLAGDYKDVIASLKQAFLMRI